MGNQQVLANKYCLLCQFEANLQKQQVLPIIALLALQKCWFYANCAQNEPIMHDFTAKWAIILHFTAILHTFTQIW